MPPINVAGFNVKETPYREYGGTSDFVNAQLQNRRYQYQLSKDREADEWRKLNLIQDLTNIDKYQTGESVADAIGNQKAGEILQHYTGLAGTLSPAELQSRITQDMQKTIGGMQSMKGELMMADQAIKARKAQFPSLDAATLMRDVRSDILHRRIMGTEFANPMTVNPSQLNLDDLDFLSDYIDVNKGLKDAIVNPKNIQKDVPVLTGSPSSYTKFSGSLPYFMKENFDREKDFKNGFYSGKSEPTMSLKTTTIPQGGFGGTNQAIDVLDKDAFEGLRAESAEVEPALIKLAKTKYRNYSSMSNEDKEIAKRDVAKDFITPFSSNYKFRAETATKPPHYSSTTNVYGSEGANLNNIYQSIKEKGLQRVNDYKEGNYVDNSLGKEDLSGDELEVVLKATNNKDLTPDDVKVIVEDNGRVGVYNKGTGERLVYLNQTGSNLSKQANVGGKKMSVEKGNEPYKPTTIQKPTTKPKSDPLGLFN